MKWRWFAVTASASAISRSGHPHQRRRDRSGRTTTLFDGQRVGKGLLLSINKSSTKPATICNPDGSLQTTDRRENGPLTLSGCLVARSLASARPACASILASSRHHSNALGSGRPDESCPTESRGRGEESTKHKSKAATQGTTESRRGSAEEGDSLEDVSPSASDFSLPGMRNSSLFEEEVPPEINMRRRTVNRSRMGEPRRRAARSSDVKAGRSTSLLEWAKAVTLTAVAIGSFLAFVRSRKTAWLERSAADFAKITTKGIGGATTKQIKLILFPFQGLTVSRLAPLPPQEARPRPSHAYNVHALIAFP
ncbi:hypothetical protein THAOC_33436 [Thalassiosira oceanica]|uniref:Uncharacterized protein n=1 Tax=Thalassiosira oceanica TaxID=159749 RepID=K0R560_THAOC|nr:hypothetical protein THAOC_33436 [Thalassiosira oceanica]|eukprot:EJK47820.1 hypothetical protein THAOC_33436 [Thalassiosira oceanica]